MSGSSAYYLVLFKNSTLIGKGQIDMSHANHSAPVAQEESAGEDGRRRAGSELGAAATVVVVERYSDCRAFASRPFTSTQRARAAQHCR